MIAPVFIGGCPRSGTTMLGAMLGAHSACVTPPETMFKERLLQREPSEHWHSLGELEQCIGSSPNLRVWAPLLEQVFQESGPQTTADLLERAVLVWSRERGRVPPSVWIDHTPSNIKHVAHLRRHWSMAKWIHVARDGRAVLASLRRLTWGPASSYRAAHWWSAYIDLGLRAEAEFAHGMVRVTFEGLLDDTEGELRRLCRFLRLDYESSLVEGGGFVPSRRSAARSANKLVGTPPRKERAAAWRKELSRRHIEIFEVYGGGRLRALGYGLEFGPDSRSLRPWEWIGCVFQDGLKALRERSEAWLRRFGA